jgi:hypothetical protein
MVSSNAWLVAPGVPNIGYTLYHSHPLQQNLSMLINQRSPVAEAESPTPLKSEPSAEDYPKITPATSRKHYIFTLLIGFPRGLPFPYA